VSSSARSPFTSSEHRPRRYLVTGASGFIGAHTVRRLVGAGCDVHATTRNRVPAEAATVTWWQVDLADSAATRRVVEKVQPDVVIHLASRAEGARDLDLVMPMLHGNVLTAVNVLAAASGVPSCRVVMAGSIEEHGARSPYSASKTAATTYATLFRDVGDLAVVVLRLAMVYGPGDPHDKRLMPYVVDSLLRGVEPALSSGRRRVDWVYVDDVVDALLAAAVEASAVGHVIDIGTGQPVTIRDAVGLVRDVIGTSTRPAFGRIPDRSGDLDYIADPVPAERLLKWRARVGLRAGIERTVARRARQLADGPMSA
jgi:nucleoside-diphosphate-sugar epimerase